MSAATPLTPDCLRMLSSSSRIALPVRQPVRVPSHELDLAFPGLALLAIEPELLDHRQVADRVDDRVFPGVVAVLVPVPARHREDVAPRPVEALLADRGVAVAFGADVDGARVLAMRKELLAGTQDLRTDRHRRADRAAGCRIHEFDDHAVVGVP